VLKLGESANQTRRKKQKASLAFKESNIMMEIIDTGPTQSSLEEPKKV